MALWHRSSLGLWKPYVCRSCRRTVATKSRTYATLSEKPELYDVVCVGGGPAGLSLLAALRASPVTSSLKLALIESQDLSSSREWNLSDGQYSNRASSLTPSSKAFLDSIGVWDHVNMSRIQPYHGMQVWDGVSGSRIEFDWQTQQAQSGGTIAYMVENANLVKSLLKRLSDLKEVSVLDETQVTDISFGTPLDSTETQRPDLSSWPLVTLSNGLTLAARLLVGADGLSSPVRKFSGIQSRGWDYDRHGVVATLKLSNTPEHAIAYQRFLPTGPVALLPLPGPYATLVWSTTPAHATLLKSLEPIDFMAMVNASFRLSTVDITYMHTISSGQDDELSWRLQHTPGLSEGEQVPHSVVAVQDSSVASFPLRFRHADTYATNRVALIGDAAHTIHPLAGQGLNMGIGDVESLSRTLEYAVSHGQDIGDQLSLEAYNAEKYEPNHRLLGVVDKLHKLYSFQSAPVVALRSWGLEAVNAITPLKEFLMRQASGNSLR